MRRSRQDPEIRKFILRHVEGYAGSVATLTCRKLGRSRASVDRYLRRLEDKGHIVATGKTRARRYRLKTLKSVGFKISLIKDLPEHQIWRFRALPLLEGLSEADLGICRYGFTEILNNAIDHSAFSTPGAR